MSLNGFWKSAVGMAALAMACGASAAPKGVAIAVEAEKHALGQNDDVVVKVTLTNTSNEPQYVLKWLTPFEGMDEPLFEVTRDGEAVPYTGKLIKRGAPKKSDYWVLKPGAKHTVKVELSAAYDMSVTGDYQISYKVHSPSLFMNASGTLHSANLASSADSAVSANGQLESSVATVWIDGRLPRGATPQAILDLEAMKRDAGVQAASLGFTNCTSSQQSTIQSAMAAGSTMANSSNTYMAKTTMGPRYTKWFGTVTTSRKNTVKSHFAAIKDAFDNKPVVVDCSCKQSYYAYVYPTQPYKIYVCNAFWSAPMSGTDSKGGTMVHELSHFNAVAGTDDHVYGQSGAANLALTNPNQAVDNADSHEYFAENTPALN